MRNAIALAHATRDESEINLTPMLDVVFIMLIFFIVTATFVREAGLAANRPDAKVIVEPTSEAILIAIDSNDDIRIEGRVIDSRALRANIERLHAERPDHPVVIEPAKSSTARTLVAVMDAARLVGVSVSIASE